MEIKEIVKERYGQAALRVTTGGSSCCGAAAPVDCCDPITAELYDANQTAELPPDAVRASLGCGNPTALAQLNAGETVLDLGSGGGIDVLLSARSTWTLYDIDLHSGGVRWRVGGRIRPPPAARPPRNALRACRPARSGPRPLQHSLPRPPDP